MRHFRHGSCAGDDTVGLYWSSQSRTESSIVLLHLDIVAVENFHTENSQEINLGP